MNPERLIEEYIDAWNQQETEGVLALMHDGAAYYDAFWRESCVGSDLVRYFHDSFEDYPFFYRMVGNVIVTGSGAAFRYSAYEQIDSEAGNAVFHGVEVLTIRDGKILTVSNHYCDPRQDCIMELAELEAARHGESRYAKSGLPFRRFSQIKRQISAAMSQDKAPLNPTMTISQLSDQIGCSTDQLLRVLCIECISDIHDHSVRHRAQYDGDMIRKENSDKVDLSHIAAQAGFRSFEDFCNAFAKSFSDTPTWTS